MKKIRKYFLWLLEKTGFVLPTNQILRRANFFLNETFTHMSSEQLNLANLAMKDALIEMRALTRR